MKKLVIIGGGFAGAKIAKHLENKFKTILIDTKNYFEFTPGILRTLIEPKHAEKIQTLHKNYLKKTTILKDDVTNINEKYVLTKSKNKISFDYLVICPGSNYNLPFKEEDIILTTRSHDLINEHHKLKHAKKIIIIGGGIVGVELAAEIVTKYKNKKIYIIHSKERLMNRNNIKSSLYAEKFLKKHNVDLLLNNRAKNKVGKVIHTTKGKNIEADMIFLCTGIKPNSDFLEKKFKKVLDERKAIKVNKYLQVETYKNIFAAGDVTNIKEEKTAQSAEKQAGIIIKNIQYLKDKKQLDTYIEKKLPMIISLGKYNGIFEINNIVLTGLIPVILKWFVEYKTMIKYKR